MVTYEMTNIKSIINTIILIELKSQLSGLTPVSLSRQRGQRDSTAEVDQLCFSSVFNLTEYDEINYKSPTLSVWPL